MQTDTSKSITTPLHGWSKYCNWGAGAPGLNIRSCSDACGSAGEISTKLMHTLRVRVSNSCR